MKTFVLILAMMAMPSAVQDKQTQKTEPQQIAAQPPSPQQLITFTAEQLDEYENKILDRAEKFYAFVVAIVVAVCGILIPLGVTGLIQYQRKISFKKELETQSRKFDKALADDSAIHFLEHAKGLPDYESFPIDKFSLLLLSAKRFAESENINGIHRSFEFIKALKMPTNPFSRNIESQHDMLLSQYHMTCKAIRKSGFEKEFATQLKSIETKIRNWYSNLSKNKKPQ